MQGFEVTGKYFQFNQCCPGTSPAHFAWEKFQKLLHFVQRGLILLRCGSALALSLPSLGVSSLDLGRLFTQAALFSCALFFALRFSSATSAEAIAMDAPVTDFINYSAAAWNGPRSPSESAATCANLGPRSRRRSSM